MGLWWGLAGEHGVVYVAGCQAGEERYAANSKEQAAGPCASVGLPRHSAACTSWLFISKVCISWLPERHMVPGVEPGVLAGQVGKVPRSPHSSNAARATPRCSSRPALSCRQTGWQKGWQHRKIRESLSTRIAESVTAGTLCGPAPEPPMLTKHALLHLHEAAWFTVGLT